MLSATPQPTVQPRHLALFGATRGIGRELLGQALEAGHAVRALARDPSSLPADPRLTVVEGGALDPEAVRRTITGADAVLCALGAPARSDSKVRSEGTKHIVRAMEELGVRRLVCVSVFGAAETRASLPFFLKYVIFPLFLRRVVAEHERQERVIADSSLEWTIVRPPHLVEGGRTGLYAHGFAPDAPGLTYRISRADVAELMLREVVEPRYVRRAVGISYEKARAA